MAFKFIVAFSAFFAYANAGGILAPVSYHSPLAAAAVYAKVATPAIDAVASTHQNVVRSFGGTVSTYSKAVGTPYSSVRKTDARITNNVYTPAVAKTLTYAAPATAVVKTLAFDAPVAAKTITLDAPIVAKSVSYAAPAPPVARTVTYAAPAPPVAKTVTYAAPAVALAKTFAAPLTSYAAPLGPVAYTQPAPSLVKPVLSYSPAVAVAHVNFDAFGAHWGY